MKLSNVPSILTLTIFAVVVWFFSLSVALAVGGTAFMVLGALGVYRMPDVYCRMHALSKASTLGVAGVLLALAFELGDTAAITKVWLAVFFLILTVPISTHALGRASYLAGFAWFREAAVDQWGRFGASPTTILFQRRSDLELRRKESKPRPSGGKSNKGKGTKAKKPKKPAQE